MAVINLRVTDEQKAQLTDEATKHGLKLGTWVKARLFASDFSLTQLPEPDLKPARTLPRRFGPEPTPPTETGPRSRPVVSLASDREVWPTFGSSRPAPKPSSKK